MGTRCPCEALQFCTRGTVVMGKCFSQDWGRGVLRKSVWNGVSINSAAVSLPHWGGFACAPQIRSQDLLLWVASHSERLGTCVCVFSDTGAGDKGVCVHRSILYMTTVHFDVPWFNESKGKIYIFIFSVIVCFQHR